MIQSVSTGPLCWLVPLLLGGAIVPWLVWALLWPRLRSPARGTIPLHPAAPFGILWFTAACRDALGDCGTLAKLRRMSEGDIARLLFRQPLADGEAYPTQARFRTWPQQAELICAGRFDELRDLQAQLRADDAMHSGAVSPPSDEPKVESGSTPNDGLRHDVGRIVFVTSALILLLAVVAYALGEARGWCRPIAPKPDCPQVSKFTLNMPSEQLFAYAAAEIALPAVEQEVLKDWAKHLSAFRWVKVTSIRATTDPIGGMEFNAVLAAQRGTAVRTLLQTLADRHVRNQSGFPTRIEPSTLPAPTGSGADPAQLTIWHACRRAYNDELPNGVQPLAECPSKATGRGCGTRPAGEPPTVFGEFELASNAYDARRRDSVSRTVIDLMRNERKLIECLAPMRRVVVEFEGEVAGSAGTTPAQTADGSTR